MVITAEALSDLRVVAEPIVGQRLHATISAWVMVNESLASRRLEGVVKAVTRKAVLLAGSASTLAGPECNRCLRPLTHPASLTVGYGPTCSAYVGAPWDEVEAALTDEQRTALREQITRTTSGEWWLPRISTTFRLITDAPLGCTTAAVPMTPPSQPDATLSVVGHEIRCATRFEFRDRAKSVSPAWWNAQGRYWSYTATEKAAAALLAAFSGLRLEWDVAFEALAFALPEQTPAQRAAFLLDAARAIDRGERQSMSFDEWKAQLAQKEKVAAW